MERLKFIPKEIKKVGKELWKRKGQIGVAATIVTGNAIAGGIIIDGIQKVNNLENRVGALNQVAGELIRQDVLTTKSLCILEGEIYAAPPDVIEEVCTGVAGKHAEYWQGVVDKVNGK